MALTNTQSCQHDRQVLGSQVMALTNTQSCQHDRQVHLDNTLLRETAPALELKTVLTGQN